MITYLVPAIGAIVSLGVIVELLRRRQLREKYAVLWLVVGTGIGVLTLFPGLLNLVADMVGVKVPANLLFFGSLVLLLCVTVHLSWELSRLEDETRTLAEEVAILRLEVEQGRKGSRPPRPGATDSEAGSDNSFDS